jgi:transposase-like protein
MPKKIDPAVRERVMRMVADHRGEYSTPTELAKVIAARERIGRETVRRWIVQADVDPGARPGVTSGEPAEIKTLKAMELAQHVQLKIDTGVAVYFADPHSLWQRGTNENTNGLLRQYFSKGTDLSRWSAEDLEAVASTLNGRPRKTLGWKTPAEALTELLASTPQAGVASTG